jgi:hypothetical protein
MYLKIATQLNLRPEQIAATVDLLDAGNTLPFIAHHRKEATGRLDRVGMDRGEQEMTQIEQWAIFELSLKGPKDGNPFVDVSFGTRFSHKHRVVEVNGFYDGDGVYRVRFMPDAPGPWSYVTTSSRAELNGVKGQFTCTEPGLGNHGPVRVSNTYHFAYADGSPYFPIGTTCYVWNHQGDTLEEQTLETLRAAPFNKMRMCVFPKHYVFNQNEPVYHAFERTEAGEWDYARFNPAFFQHLEQRIGDLRDLGIEADLILFHPYDRWGYATMDAETNEHYLRYLVARLAAYRNVWWSLANEYDLMEAKAMADWDRFFRIVQASDPYQHLRSIHNCRQFYDHGKPWVTHCSIQHHDLKKTTEWRELYGKPVVMDECGYEGDVEFNWGNLTPQELVNRFWEGTVRGGYVGHGETYLHPQDVLWWSKGGVLHGQSPARIAFLRRILEEGPTQGIDPATKHWNVICAGVAGEYYLHYFGNTQSVRRFIALPEDIEFSIETIDAWEMTITPLEGTYSGRCEIPLPGKPYIALRIRKAT